MARSPEALAQAWVEAWNARDLEAILAHYAEDVEFTSPLVKARGADASGTLRGKAALRAYFTSGLAAAPSLRFDQARVLRGVGSLTLLYRSSLAGEVAEVMGLDAEGRVAWARVHYAVRG